MAKILIADDDPDILMLLASRLKSNMFDVVTAQDCNTAVKKAYAEAPDLILLDIRMPRVGGIKTFSNLKLYSRTENIPVIFITAFPGEEVEKEVRSMGANDFIAKPFDTEELLAKIKKALNLGMNEKVQFQA